VVPLRVKPPVAVEPPAKHGLEEVKFRFVMLRPLPLVCVRVTVKFKTGEVLPELSRDAVQFPLMLRECDPHPASASAIPSKAIVQIDFMTESTPVRDELTY
jgi:hypothetical protein